MPVWLNLPNVLTLARAAAIPFVAWAILSGRAQAALILFFLAALTDAADGILARSLRQATTAGAYLDPIVDKLFLSGIYLALGVAGRVEWWLVILIFSRDALILAGAVVLRAAGRRRFTPSIWGKASTCAQIGYALAVLGREAWGPPSFEAASRLLEWVVVTLIFVSGTHYLWRSLTLRAAATSPD